MTSVIKTYADWKQQYPPSHTAAATASIAIDEKEPRKFVDDFVRLAERDYPNHIISGKVSKDAHNGVVGDIAFEPVVAP